MGGAQKEGKSQEPNPECANPKNKLSFGCWRRVMGKLSGRKEPCVCKPKFRGLCPKPCPETHVFILVGVLGLGGVGDGSVTVGAVVFTVLQGCPRVRHDQELLDVTLQGGEHTGSGGLVLLETPARGCDQRQKHKEMKSKKPGQPS